MSMLVNPATLTAVAGLIAIAAGIWSFVQEKEEKQQLADKNEEIATLAKENASLSKEIAKISQKVIDSIDGGDSYPVIVYHHILTDGEHDIFQGELVVIGDNPIECMGGTRQNHTEYKAALDEFKRKYKESAPNFAVQKLRATGVIEDVPPMRVFPDGEFASRRGQLIPGRIRIPHSADAWELNANLRCRNGMFVVSTRLMVIDVATFGKQWFTDGIEVKKRVDSKWTVLQAFISR